MLKTLSSLPRIYGIEWARKKNCIFLGSELLGGQDSRIHGYWGVQIIFLKIIKNAR